jgi:hypothetical protein
MKQLLFITIIFMMISTACAADTLAPTVSPSVDILGNGLVKVSGTAADTTNDVNVTAGITRVEVKLDSGNWVTASGTTSFEYTFSGLSVGNHVISVRSIDYSHNPSDIVFVDFQLTSSDVPIDDDDLSWYISITGLHVQTVTDVFNVMKVPEGTDININFDIENDYDQPVNLRWILTKGTYELKDNVQVRPGKSVSVSEWISGSYITTGTHRFTVQLIDWDTKETISEKTLTLTVTENQASTAKKVSGDQDEIPQWFLLIAEQNGWKLPASGSSGDLSDVQQTLDAHEQDLKSIRTEIASLKNSNSNSGSQNTSTNSDGIDNRYIYAAIVGLFIYFQRDWIKERIGSNTREPHAPSVNQLKSSDDSDSIELLRT